MKTFSLTVLMVILIIGCSSGDKPQGPLMDVAFERPSAAEPRGVLGQEWRIDSWVLTTECEDNVTLTVTESPYCLVGANLGSCRARPASFVLNGKTYQYSYGFSTYDVGEFGVFVNVDDSTDKVRIQIMAQIPNPITARFSVRFIVSHVASGGVFKKVLFGATGTQIIGTAPVMPLNMTDLNYLSFSNTGVSYQLPVLCDELTTSSDGSYQCGPVTLNNLRFIIADFVPGTVIDTAYLDTVLVNAPTLGDSIYAGKVTFIVGDSGTGESGGFNFNNTFALCHIPTAAGECPIGESREYIMVAKYDFGGGGISYIYWTLRIGLAAPITWQSSQKIALVTSTLVPDGTNYAGLGITNLLISAVTADPGLVEPYDTIALEMIGSGSYVIPTWATAKVQMGAKLILIWNKSLTGFSFPEFGISTAHYHGNARITATSPATTRKGTSLITAAWNAATVGAGGARYPLQLYSSGGIELCGTLFYNAGDNRGPFHAYRPDTATRWGVIFLLGVNYFGEGPIDFSEPFLKAHFDQVWDPSERLSADVRDESGQPMLKCADEPGLNPGLDPGVGKPVIYFYPEKEMKVGVKVHLTDGRFVTTFPKYDASKGGWEIIARPDGTIRNLADNNEYSYIYWTGATPALQPDLSEGFLVKGKDTASFLREKLSSLGLTPKEYNEMIVYWLPYMKSHKYNVIKFLAEEYTEIAEMEITPKPDSLLRVFMVFSEADEYTVVKEQQLPPKFVRKGFTVVEWGGSELNGDWSVFH